MNPRFKVVATVIFRAFRRADMHAHINRNPRLTKASAQGRRPEARTAQGTEFGIITEVGAVHEWLKQACDGGLVFRKIGDSGLKIELTSTRQRVLNLFVELGQLLFRHPIVVFQFRFGPNQLVGDI